MQRLGLKQIILRLKAIRFWLVGGGRPKRRFLRLEEIKAAGDLIFSTKHRKVLYKEEMSVRLKPTELPLSGNKKHLMT